MSETQDGPNAEWRPDPFGRYEWRRFFLDQPTSLVMRDEVVGYDQIDTLAPESAVSVQKELEVPSWWPVPETHTPYPAPQPSLGNVPSSQAASYVPGHPPLQPAESATRILASRLHVYGRARAGFAVAGILTLIVIGVVIALGLGTLLAAPRSQWLLVVGHHPQRSRRADPCCDCGVVGDDECDHRSSGGGPKRLVATGWCFGPRWIECDLHPTEREADVRFERRIAPANDFDRLVFDQSDAHDQSGPPDHDDHHHDHDDHHHDHDDHHHDHDDHHHDHDDHHHDHEYNHDNDTHHHDAAPDHDIVNRPRPDHGRRLHRCAESPTVRRLATSFSPEQGWVCSCS